MSETFYEEVLRAQLKPTAHTNLHLAGAVFVAASFVPLPLAGGSTYTNMPDVGSGTAMKIYVDALAGITAEDVEAQKIVARIREVAMDPDLRDDGEPAPPPAVVEEATRIINDASDLVSGTMPAGRVSTFFGELNVTWRTGDNVVRLACFADGRRSLIQFGSLSAPIGSYRSEPNATAELLAKRLNDLAKGTA